MFGASCKPPACRCALPNPGARWLVWGVVLLATASGSFGASSSRVASAPDQPSRSAAGGSFAPVFSADGRRLVFLSTAPNLAGDDNATPNLNVLVCDLGTLHVNVVSADVTGSGAANADAHSFSVSSNGQWIGFVSAASNLIDDDTNEQADIFLRDTAARQTRRITRPPNGQGPAVGDPPSANVALSGNPFVSADGGRVFFESYATNLFELPDTNRAPDVFMFEVASGDIELISRTESGTGSAQGASHVSSVGGSGRWVAFTSDAHDLVPQGPVGGTHLYVRDVDLRVTRWVSQPPLAGWLIATQCWDAILSAAGEDIVFAAQGDQTGVTYVVHFDLRSGGGSAVLGTNAMVTEPPALSVDGRYAAYETGLQVWVWDRVTGSNMLASVGTNGLPADQRAYRPSISADGRRVLFLSSASNLFQAVVPGVAQAFLRDVPAATTELVSAGEAGAPNRFDLAAAGTALSPDGLWVAFDSGDLALVTGDRNHANDVFLRDPGRETTTLVSRAHPNKPRTTGVAMTKVEPGGLSRDGRRLAFTSLDTTLSDGDTNGVQDTYVATLADGSVERVERRSVAGVDRTSNWKPILSADGRRLAYLEAQGNISSPTIYGTALLWADLEAGLTHMIAPNSYERILEPASFALSSDGQRVCFRSDRTSRTALLMWNATEPAAAPEVISANATGGEANGESIYPAFTGDGQWVLFQSLASNLTTNVVSGATMQLFARHLPSLTTRLLSYQSDGRGMTSSVGAAVSSGDSRYAAFHTTPDLMIYRHDLLDASPSPAPNLLVCSNCQSPSLDFTGDRIAFVSQADPSSLRQVMVKDLMTGQVTLVSANRAGRAGGNGHSFSPWLSRDNCWVVFGSVASDLVENDNNGAEDVFARELTSGITLLLSRNWGGTGTGQGRSLNPVLSGDGRVVAFRSFADDLVPGDYNLTADIFVVRLGCGDTDGDGLDDDWEGVYFNSLARDGTGDFDQDGATDAAEYAAGTDPTNQGSVFRVVTLTRPPDGTVVLVWRSAPGKAYRVERSESLTYGEWVQLPGDIYATRGTASAVDFDPGGTGRFYRVRLVP